MPVASFEGAVLRFHTFPKRTFLREKGDCGRRSHARWTLFTGRLLGARWAATGESQVAVNSVGGASISVGLLLCKDVDGGPMLR